MLEYSREEYREFLKVKEDKGLQELMKYLYDTHKEYAKLAEKYFDRYYEACVELTKRGLM